ncbi:MAG: hypothetical protein ACQETH_10595 [Candidatus Rifleibacteriota bacterium]
MNGKQLFCLSLVILSVAMGIHWFKHKPKTRKRPTRRPKVALDIKDLQIQDENKQGNEEETPVEDLGDDNQEEQEQATETEELPDETQETSKATDTTEIATASDTEELPSELDDPIIAQFHNIKRNPFEKSPYAELVEELRAQQELENQVEEVTIKPIEVMNANFSATIKAQNKLVAIIDSRLYREGDQFQQKPITKIEPSLVTLDTNSTLFLIPKVGVQVDVATDGTYTYQDTFREN